MNNDSANPHPSPEQWGPFLYGELAPRTQASLERHLGACAECRKQVDQWRATMSALDAWKLPAPRASIRAARPVLRWAAAAAVLLGAGLVTGRLTAPRLSPDQLQAEVQRQLQSELATTTAALQAESDRKLEDLAHAWAIARAQDQQTTLALFQRSEAQRKTDLAWLRRDIETLAVNAEERIETTQRGLSQLAAVSQTLWERPDPSIPNP